ncbi:universal stress protein [Natronomonas gomsonensis]|jgi:nucleotide-binding universal stress UspA family protein|uniref:universal stress protein n=1 Tax=Natronomonas gomsonensis TaxID=1046043 RepID=UPI0020CA4E84|nr:universal stress protein [Natronomonas gomsonensis]MCY4731360.1 universal stress protein [Natronomonas gomsonensis]
MEVETVLVPVDGSDAAMEAVEYATAIAERYDAVVHALYVLGENAAAAMEEGSVEAAAIAERGEQVMAGVRAVADGIPVDHSSAYGYSQTRLSQHPGSVILDVTESLEADFVVIPREPVTGDPEAVIEKAAEYVLAHASQPVLSV